MKDARKAPQIGVRLPVELKKWLEQKAEANHRSLNGEVIARLEQSLKQEEAQHEKAPA